LKRKKPLGKKETSWLYNGPALQLGELATRVQNRTLFKKGLCIPQNLETFGFLERE